MPGLNLVIQLFISLWLLSIVMELKNLEDKTLGRESGCLGTQTA